MPVSPKPADAEERPAVASPEVADFLLHLEKEKNVSPHTLRAYSRDLGEFTSYLRGYYGSGDWSWAGVDRLAIRGFLSHLTRRRLSKRTIARSLSAVRSFYAYMHRNEDVESNPARSVSRSEEHTSELQSRLHLVCRLLLEKKNKNITTLHMM